jgi:Tol biopolymer transport system component/DNA-binding SARP family transcriptional activator
MSAPKFLLQTLGGLSMSRIDGGAPVMVGHRKRLGLMAILASTPSPVSRERLASLLQPESDEARARNALKQLLFTVRRELGEDALSEVNGALTLSTQIVQSDVGQFREQLATKAFVEAVSLYRGPFLDAVYLRGAPEFERWADEVRDSLANDYATALESLASSALASKDAPAAVRWARARAGCDPLSSRAALLLVQALDANGDRAAAIRHGELHASLLREECGIEMPPEVAAVLHRLRETSIPVSELRESSLAPPVAATGPIAIPTETTPTRRSSRASRAGRGIAAGVAIATALAVMLRIAVAAAEHAAGRSIRAGAMTQINTQQSGRSQPAISPDGKWIAFAANRIGDPSTRLVMRIYVQQINGTRAFPVTSDSTVDQESPVWSPDGTRLAFRTQRANWLATGNTAIQIAPALGGTPETLISDPAGGRALELGGWSHDGTRIAFSDTSGVWVYDLQHGRTHFLTRTGFRPHSATWSADDSLIAYVVGTGGIWNIAPSAIWIVRASGGTPAQVTDAVHSNTSPVFTPDGNSFLYVSNRDGAHDLYQQPVANGRVGSRITRLTTGSNISSISLTSDGRNLVYGSRTLRSNIWSAPISARDETPVSAARQVTFGDQEVECLSVSRDGAWLLYDSNRSGNQDIYKVPVSGGDPMQLTTDRADDFCPTMSHDGQEIAFYSFRTGGVRRVFTMLASGARQRQVIADSSGEQQWAPHWSPDGRMLAIPASHGGARYVEVTSRDEKGEWTDPRRIANAPNVAWSPDGRWLATCGDSGLTLVSPDGQHRRQLVPPGRLGSVAYCAWGPDPAVVHLRTLGKDAESLFWSVPIADGRPRLLLRLGDPAHNSRRAEFAVGANRLYFTLSSDDAAIWRLELIR